MKSWLESQLFVEKQFLQTSVAKIVDLKLKPVLSNVVTWNAKSAITWLDFQKQFKKQTIFQDYKILSRWRKGERKPASNFANIN